MNAEVTAVEEKKEERREGSCTEGEVVELGVVSKDTQGFYGAWFDPGYVGRQF